MTLKIYGFITATCTQRVIATAIELSLPYEFVLVDLVKREQKGPEFLAKSPFGLTPAIVSSKAANTLRNNLLNSYRTIMD